MKIANIQQENKFKPNPTIAISPAPPPIVTKGLDLEAASRSSLPWVKEDTAILIIHGIGNQNPLETLDDFARGLIKAYHDHDITITHQIASKTSDGKPWFDNFIRLRNGDNGPHIDIYEYYWANLTQNKISFAGVQRWITSVVREAKSFYDDNMDMELKNGEHSTFFKKAKVVNGKMTYEFIGWKYSMFLRAVSLLLPIIKFISTIIRWVIKKVGGAWLEELYCNLEKKFSLDFANVIGDIAIYNTADVKSELYQIRRNILAGAVDAVKYLIEPPKVEPPEKPKPRSYGKVLIAGHSLGTQIAYDAINRIDHLINLGKVEKIDVHGHLLDPAGEQTGKRADQLIAGFVTFGSPLDKIAFFLREHVDSERILMLQIVTNYHSFKQRNWYQLYSDRMKHLKVKNTLERLFEQVKWRNYFDRRDYVSGSLDFYEGVMNVNCDFATNAIPLIIKGKTKIKKSKTLSFTHSWYWNHEPMFKDIIEQFLTPVNPPQE